MRYSASPCELTRHGALRTEIGSTRSPWHRQRLEVAPMWRWAVIPLAFSPLLAAPPTPGEAKPAPELNALFEHTDGWTGADGAYSVALSPRRILWLYSDTWVGQVRDGKRTN